MRRAYLSLECLTLTVGLPLALYYNATRPIMMTTLWGGALLAFLWLRRQTTWRDVWNGQGITPEFKKHMALRFALMMVAAIGATMLLDPDKLFAFPVQRTRLWLLVMLLYPILSAFPQEIIYRAFFYQRYAPLLSPALLGAISAIAFGLSHLMMNNPVAPILSILGGLVFADTYARTRSLKWATLEHAAYGCAIFTIGLGWFFYLGNWR